MSEANVKIRASIVGGSGYGGGEVLRLLLGHSNVEVAQVTSRSQAGTFVHSTHPNLRGRTSLQFVRPEELAPCDVLFLCLPHGEASKDIERYVGMATRIVDLSADFRLRDKEQYRKWYEEEHPCPQWLDRCVYGLPEFHRQQLKGASLASGVGCNATAMNLSLFPLARKGLIQTAICDVKVGSSEAGAVPTAGSHHPERAGVVRSYAPVGHRHAAEVEQELMREFGKFDLHVSLTAVELVRGVLCTSHILPTKPMDERTVWGLFREAFADQPFVRIVKDRVGIYRAPEPKVLAGTNWCDVGFAVEEGGRRVVVMAAIDNLMKGAAGSAVQSMNLMCGFDEAAGLGFCGLHPS